MTGTLKTPSGTLYAFTDEHSSDAVILAWDVHDEDYSRMLTHKWAVLPKGEVNLFDFENPPATVTFLPLLFNA